MTTAVPSSSPSEAMFRLIGMVTGWDPILRRLQIVGRDLWLAPGVSIAGMTDGVQATASGYVASPGARWIVTDLAVT